MGVGNVMDESTKYVSVGDGGRVRRESRVSLFIRMGATGASGLEPPRYGV